MVIKETVPFNFDDTYNKLVELFEARGYDSIYEGSNTAQLITAMAYLTSMLNVNTAVNINEMLLTTATKRDNVYHDAKLLGYEPAYITSYQYKLELTFAQGGVYVIPTFTKFTSGDKVYYYMGERLTIDTNVESNIKEIIVKEGILHTYDNNPDTLNYTIVAPQGETEPQHYIDIPYSDIEQNGLLVYLTYINEENTTIQDELWGASSQFMIDRDSELSKQYVRLDNVKYRTPRLYFKFAGVGAGLRLNTLVKVNALVSSGVDGAMTDNPTTELNCEVTNYTLEIKGEDEEDISSVKANAPLFFNSGNRAVTKIDYVAICNRLSSIQSTEVWGGDDEYPQIPGHIWFSFIPQTITREILSTTTLNTQYILNNNMSLTDKLNNYYLTGEKILDGYTADTHTGEIGVVFNELNKYKIPTLIFHNRHPIYIDFDIDIEVLRYDLGISRATINRGVFEVIDEYFNYNKDNTDDVYAEQFNFEFFKSNLTKRIDIELSDATGFESSILTSVAINQKMLISEKQNTDNIDIIIPLGVPYENYFPGNVLDETILPQFLGTDVFGGFNLSVDWASLSSTDITTPIITADILVNGIISGKYTLFNSFRKYITVELYVNGGTGDGVYGTTAILKNNVLDEKININYKSSNIQFIKNCIPRLNSVNFVG